tara:strand:+ start:264 stop:389 length:126 start_codon:yes stop_codon:yes gene_type:complete
MKLIFRQLLIWISLYSGKINVWAWGKLWKNKGEDKSLGYNK